MTVYKSSSKIADTGVHGINFGSQQIKQIFTAPRTNGITYIPQDIKFDIVNGTTPTLYAGSEVWVPYGRNAPEYSIGDSLNSGIITAISWDGSALFYKVRYDTDLNIDITDDPAVADFVTSIGTNHRFYWYNTNVTYSQDTAPSGFWGQYALWYDTAENVVKCTSDSGATWNGLISLPIGVFTMAGTGATKTLKYVFNGVGYIGTTVFAVPGVKGLMADGLNEDGSYKTISRTIEYMTYRNLNLSRENFYCFIRMDLHGIDGEHYIEADELPETAKRYTVCYRKTDNTLWWTTEANSTSWFQIWAIPVGFISCDGTKITSWEPAKNFIKVYQYNSYEPQQILVNISGTASTDITFKRGVYYIRAQGAGGGGGNYAYPYGNGNGGGSGAGFEGYIYVSKEFSSSVTTGVGGNSASAGVNTQINGVMLLGAGQAGPTTSGGTVDPSGVPGTITIDSNNLNNLFTIISATVNRDGNYGSKAIGGNSVLTNSGAGQGAGGAATAPGAGGGGTSSIGGKGGPGGDGECLIQYIGYEPEGGVTKLEYFQTPTLTASITPVAEGNIVVTSSYNNTSSWNNLCNNSYIMRNTISTTSDSGYWQMNGSNTQWLQIKFPYTLIIKGMTIASRPRDNYTGTVTAYTNADKIVNMGSVTTNAKATNFTLTNIGIGAFVTDTIYLYITDMDEWYGLQNLQIRGYKVLDNSLSLSLFPEPDLEPSEVTYYCYDDTGSNYTYLYTTTTDFVVGEPVTFHINKQIKDNVAYTELATSSADFNDTVSVTPTELRTNSFKYKLLMSGYYLTYEFKRTPDYDFTE